MTRVKFVPFRENAKAPTKVTQGSAGYDLYSIDNEEILPGRIKPITTGIALEWFDPNIYGRITSTSSMAIQGIIVLDGELITSYNSAISLTNYLLGVVNPDYRGEINVVLLNTLSVAYSVKIGQQIGQIIFERYEQDIQMEKSDTLSLTFTKRVGNTFVSTGL